MSSLYVGKFSSNYPEQIEEKFYAAGKEGTDWYGGIRPGDYVFPIYQGKIDALWRVKEYTQKHNRIMKDDFGAVIFDEIKKLPESIRLSDEFIRYKYFELNLNILNKSSKSVKNCGFIPIQTTDNCPNPELIEFKNNLRNIYITLSGVENKCNEEDVVVVIDDIQNTTITNIEIFKNGKFITYNTLMDLYKEKNPINERYTLRRLLEYSVQDIATNKEKYIQTVMQDLEDSGSFMVSSPIALYDNILVGRKKYFYNPHANKNEILSKNNGTIPEIDEENEPDDELLQYEKYADLMLFNPNIILYGPPGTGKTYSTMKIIERFEKKFNNGKGVDFKTIEKEGRAKFITFHQAYSYEEFIEGIRPQLSNDLENEVESDGLRYVIEDGILKKMAIAASTQELKSDSKVEGLQNTTHTSKIWKVSLGSRNKEEDIYKECKESKNIAIGFLHNDDISGKTYNEIYSLLQKESGKDDSKPISAASSLDAIVNQMNKGDIVLIYDSPTTIRDIGVINGEYEYKKDKPYPHTRSVVWIKEFNTGAYIFDYNGQTRLTLKTIYGLNKMNLSDINELLKNDSDDILGSGQKNTLQPYYLIIDEINRGNIAKIFGELITLIEKDKREKINCYLPYSKKPFTLPRNLYLIGTMNTADRSIALLDTALRRRFAFIEFEPDLSVFNNPSVVAKVNDTIELPKLLEKLNEKITKKLDRDHRIGHSYFMDMVSLSDLYKGWYYKIIPLLTDYFYGDIDSIEQIIGKDFFGKEGNVVFLETKRANEEISEFEKAIFKIYVNG